MNPDVLNFSPMTTNRFAVFCTKAGQGSQLSLPIIGVAVVRHHRIGNYDTDVLEYVVEYDFEPCPMSHMSRVENMELQCFADSDND